MGFEPTTFGTTIRHSNQLSYIHRVIRFPESDANIRGFAVLSKQKCEKDHKNRSAAISKRVSGYLSAGMASVVADVSG